jgi:hypothetical protein
MFGEQEFTWQQFVLAPKHELFFEIFKIRIFKSHFFCQTVQLDIYLRNAPKNFCFKIPYILGDIKEKFLTNNTYFWYYKQLDLFLFYSPK